jgi:Flp pilus assembly pilin Flp
MKAAYRQLKLWAKEIQASSAGQDLIEYALMAAFLAVACAALMPALGSNVSRLLSVVGSALIVAKNTGS